MSGEGLLAAEPTLRLSVFLGMLALMAVWELAAPARRIEIPRLVRWSNNLGLVVVDTLLVRLAFPMLAVGLALVAADRGWGLLNLLALPGWLAGILAFLAFDLVIYGQHVVFHKVPWLWPLHRVHHADPGIDTTTALRFHPGEILISMVLKLLVVLLLGPPAVAVLIFEVVLNGSALFNHANIRLPAPVERVLRLFIITPDVHRVHHSIYRDETDSNYGFNLIWWDWLFRTYRAQPRDGHAAMRIGQAAFRTPRDQWLDRLLIQPLRRPKSAPIRPVGSEPDRATGGD